MRLRQIALSVVTGLVFLTLPAIGQVTGTWAGKMATGQGDADVSYTFMEDGDKLTGSSTGPDGNVVEISDGMIDGEDISFNLTVDFGGMPLRTIRSSSRSTCSACRFR
jgi:hypothetical protein